jgi:hypothetical protein
VNIPNALSDIRAGVLYDMTTDAAWMLYEAHKGRVTRQEIAEYARRQELRVLLLDRELRTLETLGFARDVISDLEALP